VCNFSRSVRVKKKDRGGGTKSLQDQGWGEKSSLRPGVEGKERHPLCKVIRKKKVSGKSQNAIEGELEQKRLIIWA